MLIITSKFLHTQFRYVYRYFWDMHKWLNIWPSMQSIEMLYEDAFNQELLIKVTRENEMESNRTFRSLTKNYDIEFFSTVPPPMMEMHRGRWQFQYYDNGCMILATREFLLRKNEGESQEDFEERERIFTINFRKRLESILDQFEQHICKRNVYA